MEHLQDQQIIIPLGVDKTAGWCNNFVIVPKPNGTIQLCFDPAKLNQALITPVCRAQPSMINSQNKQMHMPYTNRTPVQEIPT